MARKKISGLLKRGDIWHINKRFRGERIRESCGTSDLEEAERYLARRMEEIRQAEVYGVRPKRTFRQAATKYLGEATKTTIAEDARNLELLDPFIGDLPLEAVHMGSLHRFIEVRRRQKVKARTINYSLQVVRRILNLAGTEWLDEGGMTWLAAPPKIKLLQQNDAREPYPLSWEEQFRLFNQLPPYLAKMALFAVNTGCREAEICGLRWEWEVEIPQLETSAFIIPGEKVKNRRDRLVVLNRVAEAVIEGQRGVHPTHVFVNTEGNPVVRMCREAWRSGRERARLKHVRVHDLKHTFGRRLRAAGVSFEDRQDLLGHKSTRITTHYSAPELENLIAAANKVCPASGHKMTTLVVLKKKIHQPEVTQASGTI